ncbi:L-threonylcarbamoyladenylate synthase [Nitrospira lenta]|uniref:Threonylcarbamoyl-AMP synthase n=1 Tax=Nitrospira lenta TaxID=1436998 RepID=A0A330L7W6_9BACT|nr:L-threonylcarbamoyladenylate synthase [Nitrospira lenta]SPP65961.1 Threonylcarbamoyl-AMP synthase [Nitrospira lenta]
MAAAHVIPASNPESIRRAAEVIRNGGLVAFPTETVYGLGCNALNPEAVAGVFEAKQRPHFDPLIVHIATRTSLNRLVETISVGDHRLMDAFWPGPLTLVLQKREEVPDIVTAGLPTLAIRMPAHPVARALIREAGVPIAAPSANPFGYVSPTCARHVLDGLGEQVDLILDGGPCPIGVESTIVSMFGTRPEILRPGSITLAEIQKVIGPLGHTTAGQTTVVPGQHPRHYATRTPVTILATQGAAHTIQEHERAGLLALSTPGHVDERFHAVEVLSASGDLREAARNLFAALRRLDALGLDHLYVVPCEDQGLGLAIMDRLRRCAAPLAPLPRLTTSPASIHITSNSSEQ